jgi:hypothetical protein
MERATERAMERVSVSATATDQVKGRDSAQASD